MAASSIRPGRRSGIRSKPAVSYYLSKLVWLVLAPGNLIAILIVAGFLVWRRWLLAIGVGGLLAAGLTPLSTLLFLPLEERFPAFVDDGKPVHGVIVLGGVVSPQISRGRGQMALNEAAERIVAMVDLARRYPEAQVVFTGGSGDITAASTSEADMVEKTIAPLLPPGRITYERVSRNTVENAELSFRQIGPKPGERWLLVTSAWHMPRSVGIFRKAGWRVTAHPVDYLTTGTADDYRMMQSVTGGLYRTDLAAKEWAGLLFAFATGKSSALFPAPDRAP